MCTSRPRQQTCQAPSKPSLTQPEVLSKAGLILRLYGKTMFRIRKPQCFGGERNQQSAARCAGSDKPPPNTINCRRYFPIKPPARRHTAPYESESAQKQQPQSIARHTGYEHPQYAEYSRHWRRCLRPVRDVRLRQRSGRPGGTFPRQLFSDISPRKPGCMNR